MEPGDYPLKLYRGDSYKWKFVVWADAEKTQPANLQGVIPAAQIRVTPVGDLLMDLICEIELPNIVKVSLPATLWAVTVPKSAAWDLELTYPAGDVSTIIAGKVTITPDVTNTIVGSVPLKAIS